MGSFSIHFTTTGHGLNNIVRYTRILLFWGLLYNQGSTIHHILSIIMYYAVCSYTSVIWQVLLCIYIALDIISISCYPLSAKLFQTPIRLWTNNPNIVFKLKNHKINVNCEVLCKQLSTDIGKNPNL